jgi:hypothetical protein
VLLLPDLPKYLRTFHEDSGHIYPIVSGFDVRAQQETDGKIAKCCVVE